MKMEKTTTTKGGDFIDGGSKGMSGPNHAGPQKPGVSTQEGAKSADKFISGGHSNHMSGPNHAGPQKPDTTEQGGAKTSGKFAEGGKGANNKMFGYTGSKTATPA